MASRGMTVSNAGAVFAAFLSLCALLVFTPALAQRDTTGRGTPNPDTPSTNQEAAPQLDLTTAQKEVILASLVNLNTKNESLPTFQPIVGSVVPEPIELAIMPKTVGDLLPQTRDFRVAMVGGRAIIVEPASRKIVEVITAERP